MISKFHLREAEHSLTMPLTRSSSQWCWINVPGIILWKRPSNLYHVLGFRLNWIRYILFKCPKQYLRNIIFPPLIFLGRLNQRGSWKATYTFCLKIRKESHKSYYNLSLTYVWPSSSRPFLDRRVIAWWGSYATHLSDFTHECLSTPVAVSV